MHVTPEPDSHATGNELLFVYNCNCTRQDSLESRVYCVWMLEEQYSRELSYYEMNVCVETENKRNGCVKWERNA